MSTYGRQQQHVAGCLVADSGRVASRGAAARARVAASARLNAGKGERPRIQRFRYSRVLTCGACGATVRGATKAGKERYLCPAGHVSILCSEADPWIDMQVDQTRR